MPARFAKVSDKLFRGGEPSVDDLRSLKDNYNVERIVSLDDRVASRIAPTCKKLNIEHIVIPLGDGNSENVSVIKNNLKELFDSGKCTYVHCYHGKDRTSMVCAMNKISNGTPLQEALSEAFMFGMGAGLSGKVKKSYYNAIINFAKNKDSNKVEDVVTHQRRNMELNPAAANPSFAPQLDPNDTTSVSLNITASTKIYTICNSTDLLKPDRKWFTRSNMLNNLSSGTLYSAEISSDANIVNYIGNYNKTKVQIAKTNSVDIVIFSSGDVFILNPNALIHIKEEDFSDSNAVVNVGQRSNYDGLAPYSFPGSGGFMESGYGGFAGPVQLPLTQFFE